VVPVGAQQIQDGGGRHFEKTVKSPFICDRSTVLDEIKHDEAYWPLASDKPLKS